MPGIIVPDSARAPVPLGVVDQSNEKDYQTPLPHHPVFKVALLAVYHMSQARRLNIVVDPTLPNTPENARKDVGVFQAEFGGFTVVLNWTEEKRGKILPDYMGIDYGDSSCGILGPHLTIRTCWNCGLTGWRDAGKTQAWCVPMQPPSRGDNGQRPCPKCGQLDWWIDRKKVSPAALMREAAAAIAKATGRDSLFSGFDGDKAEIDMRVEAARTRKSGRTVIPVTRGGLYLPR